MNPINLSKAVHICGECGERLSDKQVNAEKITWDDMNVNLGMDICKALHIHDKWITNIKLEICPMTPPVLTLERVVMGAEHNALHAVMERYSVTPIGLTPVVDNQSTKGSN